ncbi:hypothetical protein [uncultured Psychroserpens sp.]|uniref:hypothetical protein n=1 Tax=uncultured Psychroserpens sp. TaxID=255436 RepID=UPI0026234FE6|nr:hypothetical protein [uncultured Psychroserpens sp.]
MKLPQLCIAILLLWSLSFQAQEFNIPDNYSLTSEADYKKHQQDALDAINWLENTPLNEQESKRKNVSAFVMQWLTGTPTVTISVSAYIVEVAEKNPDLLLTFLAGWAKHAIENSRKLNEMEGNVAGMKSVLKVYENNKDSGIKKDRALEKLLKKKSDKDLEKWITKKLNS